MSATTTIEETPGLVRSHTTSWDIAMSDLSEEARALTQVLEQHAEESEKKQEETVQNGNPRKRMSADKRSVTMSAIELPPVRKGEMMIDPLPCSKEKEKVLTRTRPSWLPPKDPKEEKKHLKQYQEMMALSLEAEQKRAKRIQEEQCRRDSHQSSMARIWEQHVLPNWDAVVQEPRTRELWWRGVTPRDRGTVWQKAVGNELGISEQTYTTALNRANAAESRLLKLSEEDREKEKEHHWFEDINHDVKEAFPELKIFQPDGPLHQALVEVLTAYTMYRSDIGYTHGVHCVAALLLLNLDAPNAFTTLANLLNRPIPSAFLTSNAVAIPKIHNLVLDALSYKYPALHIHLTSPNLALPPAEYLDPMLRSLFCSSKFGPDIASRIMDVYVFENDKMLIRAAVGTLAKLEARLYGNMREILDVLAFDKPMAKWDLGNEDEFTQLVREAGKVDDEDESWRGR
jgi:Rab-GTPase-TBC domain